VRSEREPYLLFSLLEARAIDLVKSLFKLRSAAGVIERVRGFTLLRSSLAGTSRLVAIGSRSFSGDLGSCCAREAKEHPLFGCMRRWPQVGCL